MEGDWILMAVALTAFISPLVMAVGEELFSLLRHMLRK